MILFIGTKVGIYAASKAAAAGGNPVLTNLTMWWDADSDYVVKDGSDLVSGWEDRSGNSNHLTGSGAQKPNWIESELNSKDVIRFNNDWMDLPADINYTGGNWTCMYVCKITGLNGTGGQALFGQDTGPGNSQHFGGPTHTNSLTTGYPYHNERNTLNRTRSDGNFSGSFASVVHTQNNILINDVDGTYGSSDTIDDMKFRRIGNRTKNAAFYFVGDIAEILVYSSELSTGDKTTNYDYFTSKYGV